MKTLPRTKIMPSRITSNTEHEPCNHGWIHNDRMATILRLPNFIAPQLAATQDCGFTQAFAAIGSNRSPQEQQKAAESNSWKQQLAEVQVQSERFCSTSKWNQPRQDVVAGFLISFLEPRRFGLTVTFRMVKRLYAQVQFRRPAMTLCVRPGTKSARQ